MSTISRVSYPPVSVSCVPAAPNSVEERNAVAAILDPQLRSSFKTGKYTFKSQVSPRIFGGNKIPLGKTVTHDAQGKELKVKAQTKLDNLPLLKGEQQADGAYYSAFLIRRGEQATGDVTGYYLVKEVPPPAGKPGPMQTTFSGPYQLKP
jgi:hypothetical protein